MAHRDVAHCVRRRFSCTQYGLWIPSARAGKVDAFLWRREDFPNAVAQGSLNASDWKTILPLDDSRVPTGFGGTCTARSYPAGFVMSMPRVPLQVATIVSEVRHGDATPTDGDPERRIF